MKPDVDRDLLGLYLMDMLDDTERAEVERRVASDPAWAEALAQEAAFELKVFEVADAAPAAVAAPVAKPAAPWWRRFLPMMVPVAALCGLLLVVGPAVVQGPSRASFTVDVVGGEQVARGAEPTGGVPVFTAGSVMRVTFAPDVRTEAPTVEITLDGAPVELPVRFAEGGGGVIEVTFGEALPGWDVAGEHELALRLNGAPPSAVRFAWQPATP